jgi:hypothetical protein
MLYVTCMRRSACMRVYYAGPSDRSPIPLFLHAKDVFCCAKTRSGDIRARDVLDQKSVGLFQAEINQLIKT